ncbi:MAG: FAD-dependent oxidoreductase, partial [Rhodobacteraceae bacterium]|nr:FAD-dependent oxidoreductase [Paracoccaceae bacterium]
MIRHVLIVGAGLSGATLARCLAEAGLRVTVIDQRHHVAGNCHTERDAETGVLVHRYGPHIFHTNDLDVWEFVQRFAEFERFEHRVKTTVQGRVYGLPINLHTLNQFFGQRLDPAAAQAFLAARRRADPDIPESYERRALATLGDELYEAFFKHYTAKQWGMDPHEIPASVFTRLPVRFSYDDRYFSHDIQAMPREGYTATVAAILDHAAIETHLNTEFRHCDATGFDHVFYTGAIDHYFGCDLGALPYRTLVFEHQTHAGDFQGCAVMNYGDPDVAWTRITEHKHFAPWENHHNTVVTKEFARDARTGDIP